MHKSSDVLSDQEKAENCPCSIFTCSEKYCENFYVMKRSSLQYWLLIAQFSI